MADNVSSKNFTSLYGVSGLPKPDPNGDVVVRGNLAVQGGNITTTATTASLFDTNATTLDIGGEATNLNLGAPSGTTTVNNNLAVGIDLTVANDIGVGNDLVVTNNANIGVDLTVGNDLAVGLDAVIGNDLSIGNDLTVGNNVCIDGDTITLRCNATTPGSALIEVNRGGGSEINAQFAWDEDYPVPPGSNPSGRWVSNAGITATGLTGGFVEIGPNLEDSLITTTGGSGKDLILDSDTDTLLFRTGTAKTNHPTFNLINDTATTVNAFGAATSLNFGASTGTTTVNNDLQVNGIIISGGTQFGNIQLAPGSNDNLITTATGDLQLASNSGVIEIQDGAITGTSPTQTLFETSATTTGSLYSRATTVNIANLPTTNSTYSIFNGPIASGQTKTIAIGGAGTSGSTTNIFIGSGQTGANSTVHLSGNVLVTKDITATGGTFGNIKVGVTTDNTIDTSSGNLTIAPATGIITVNPATIVQYAENNTRTNRLEFQSSNGNSSGVRVLAPNTGTSALAQVGAFSSSDNNNGKFINLRANNSGTDPLRIYTGTYTAGVLGASTGVAFVDNATTYATVNPSGPTNPLDLATKAYVDAQELNTTYTIDASTTTGGANFNLAGSDSSVDTIKFANGSNVTVTATDANTITIAATDTNTTYNIDATATTGGANLNLNGSDSTVDPVAFIGTGGTTVTRTDANTITIDSTAVATNQLVNGSYTFTLNADGSVTTPNVINAYDPGGSSPLTLRGGVLNPTNLVLDDSSSTTSMSQSLSGTTTSLTANTDSLTWTRGAGLGSGVSGTWSFNNDGTTSFPNYKFPYADGTANQVLKTDGSGNLSWYSPSDLNTTYTYTASSTTGGANLTLTGSDATTNTIKLTNGGYITAAYTSATEVILGSNATDANTASTIVARDASGNFSAGTITANLANAKYILGQAYATRNTSWTPPSSGLTTVDGSNGIAVASSGGGNGYSPSLSITYYSGDTTAGVNSSAAMAQRGASGTNSAPSACAINQVLGSMNFDGYATSGWASTIATTGSGGGTSAISPLQIQGYAREAFVDSAGTVTNAGMGFRVRGFQTATSMSTANRTNFIDHQLTTATYKANTFNIQGGTSTTNYAVFASTGHTIGGIDAANTLTRVRGASAGASPSLIVRNSNTVATTPATNDGTTFRFQTAGSNNTAYTIADIAALYSSTGDNQVLIQLASGDQTSGTLTSVTTLTSKVTSTTISAGTASATPGGSSVSAKLTVDASKITAAVPIVMPNYTAVALRAITGAVGWMACVNNSASGSNPNGMMAFWDTTNARWSYVHDNSAV